MRLDFGGESMRLNKEGREVKIGSPPISLSDICHHGHSRSSDLIY